MTEQDLEQEILLLQKTIDDCYPRPSPKKPLPFGFRGMKRAEALTKELLAKQEQLDKIRREEASSGR
jgi:hypothetical protein